MTYDPAGQFAELGQRGSRFIGRLLEAERYRRVRVVTEARPGEPQGEGQGDEPLLSAIVEIALEALALCLAVFTLASRIVKLFGSTANVVMSRLLGVVLAALAVQYVIDGVRAALAG